MAAVPAAVGGHLDGSDSAATPRLVGVVWGLLVLNTLGPSGEGAIIPIPTRLGQLVTMGALAAAFFLALLLNSRLRVRPSPFLLLLSILVLTSFVASAFLESGPGALARCARLALFVMTLWLLTPWWGTIRMARFHIGVFCIVLLSVVAGLVIAPGAALPEIYEGRLVGALWYVPPTQVGQFAAVVAGLTLILWLGKYMRGPHALLVLAPSIAILLLTHTRTATVGLCVGLGAAVVTLLMASARSRRTLVWTAVATTLVVAGFGSALLNWFQRGQGEDALETLTGRQKLWEALLAAPRTAREQVVGVGLSNKSFDGLPIDNAWLAVYHEQGLLGVAIVIAFLLSLLIAVVARPPSTARACAAFLLAYCLVASYTEVGLGDASLYLLNLSLAACLLARRPPNGDSSELRQPTSWKSA